MDSAQHPRRYVCRNCGRAHTSWSSRCLKCGEYDLVLEREDSPISASPLNSVPNLNVERPRLVSVSAGEISPVDTDTSRADADIDDVEPVPLDQVAEQEFQRIETGLAPLDAVLGGGLVPASVVLLFADAGCGKSSLTLQMAAILDVRVLYATGEETIVQVADRARRIGAARANVLMLAEVELDKILRQAERKRVAVLVVDSIQTIIAEDVGGHPGSPSQVRVCSERLRAWAKATGTVVWIIGHVTADGELAGPSAMKHAVDVVIDLERGKELDGRERILRCPRKNRFGPTGVVGRFELTAEGMRAIDGDGWNESFH